MKHAFPVSDIAGRRLTAHSWWRVLRPLALLSFLLTTMPAVAQVIVGRAAPTVADRKQALREALHLTATADLRPLETTPDPLGYLHEQYQLYYQGVKVEHGQVRVHSRAGKVETVSGEALQPAAGLSAQPALTAKQALQRAMTALGAHSYKWELPAEEAALKAQTGNPRATYQPQGELVWVGDFRQSEASRPLVLAWKFDIYAHEPASRDYFYINARTGEVVLRDAIIKHLNSPGATFATRYVGARTSITDNTGVGYRLRETTTSKGVTTLNLHKSLAFATAVDFIDNDNNWTAAEHDNANFDNAALDAHLGAQVTQDYWTTVHGRDSYDDKGTVLTSYVHYGNGIDNAYWNGSAMLYGDGSFYFKPLTAIDVCGHEIGHAVCQTTAALVYSNESGALNEGLSDIWGCAVENHFDPTKQVYLIGEDITLPPSGLALRSMSNPNDFDQPDTYKGTYWWTSAGDDGGVHTNSGVLNYWFYLLSAGGSGTNDFATTYSVAGIGITPAARIAYRAERFYMTPSTNYTGARKATMQAAIDLFGLGSNEVIQTAQAWRAVGVGDGTGHIEGAPTISSFAPASGVPGTVVTITGTNLGATQSVTFNGVAATLATLTSGTGISVTVPTAATTGLISLTTATGTTASAGNFIITSAGPAPAITSYSPPGGQVQGGAVTITGTSFTGATALSFNGTAAPILTNTGTVITTTVPPGATSGPLTVTTPDGTGTAPSPFTVLPGITSFSPGSGVVGTSVTITGTSFTGALSVKFNGIYVSSFTGNATTITTTVPSGATSGPITVRTPSGTATSTSFTVTPSLSIDSFSPGRGAVGITVNIRGRGFTGTSAVTFGGVNAPSFTVASDLELWVTVPVGALSGVIGVTTPLGAATSSASFVVQCPTCPTITSFTPSSGVVGTPVTISGTNFTGATAVGFNGTAAAFSVTNATTIAATVPAGATTGFLSVTTPVNIGISSAKFALPPSNDLCANTGLPELTCGATLLGTTLGSTTKASPLGSCSGVSVSAAAGGVFYRFVGTGGSVTVTTCNAATNYDTQLFVYSGSCGAYVCVGANDDQGGICLANGAAVPSTVTFASVAGTNYFIFVNGFGGAKGDFGLSATCVPVSPTITSFSPGSGPVGTSVALTGTGFSGVTGVAFNGTPAVSFSVTNATTATATVPAGATTGSITLTNLAATATSTTNFLVPPTVVITSSAGSSGGNTSTSPIPVTVTFSQPVTGFVVGGVSVGNGTASSFGGSGSSYTFNVTPAGNGLVTVDVPANAGQTSTGDGNLTAAQFSLIYTQPITAAPVVTAPANGSLLTTATPTYSGTAVAGSTVTVYVDGSSIGSTTATGGNWSKLQPAALSQGAHSVYATAQASGSAVSANSNTNSFTVDTVAPTVALASTATATTTTSPIPVTVLFSESVADFVAADVSVSNGSVSGFSGSGTSYAFNVTPAAPGPVTVNVAANRAHDAAGNGNTAAATLSRTYALPSSVRVLYQNTDYNQLSNGIVMPALQVLNDGPVAIPYAQLTLRYWLTVENFAPIVNSIFWSQLGTDRVRMSYVPLATPRQGAFGYVEYSFLPAAGTLAIGGNSGIIQSAINKNNWTDFNEADDYSQAPNRTYLPTTRITAYRNGVLIAGQEPAAVPGVISLAAYAANQTNPTTTSSISATAQLGNLGNLAVPYSDLTVRYWFSPDGTSPLVGTIDYADLNRANVTLSTGRKGTETYAELRFAASLGVLAPLSNTGDIMFRLNKANWSNFNQANDYSYRPKAPMALHPRMTVYRQGQLVYGTEPAGALARPALASGSGSVATALLLSYPNPFSTDLHLDFVLPYAGTYTLAVYDGLGRLVETLATGSANAGELRRAGWAAGGHAAGLYLVRLTSDSGVQQLRLQKE
jgi:bacillolysin